MADSQKLPTATELKFFYWQNLPALDVGLSNDATDNTVRWSTPPLDETGTLITGAFLMAITTKSGKTEIIWVPAGAVDVGGFFATGCVRGIKPKGLDFTVGDSDFIQTLDGGSKIVCVIAAQDGELIRAALQGVIATGGSGIIIGTNALGVVTLYRSTGAGTHTGWLRWNTGSNKTEYSNDGATWNTIDSVTLSNLVVVSNTDTTPGTAQAKTSSGTGITRTILNPGGNELLQISVNGTLSNLISDVTATAAEINQALHLISANVTATNLNTLTGGGNADALHTHGGISGRYRRVTYGGAVTSGQLLYEEPTTGKWQVVTGTTSTWYKNKAIAQENGVNNDTGKLVLLEGPVAGLTFNNINPTFNTTQAGDDLITVGDANGTAMAAFLVIDNSSGAECIIAAAGHTIRAKQQGTPTGALQIYLVLEQQDQVNTPACFRDSTQSKARGAIIAATTIAQANFSGVLADLSFSFSGAVTIPAGVKVYLVLGKATAVNNSNYYIIGGQPTMLLDQSTQTWSGTAQTGYVHFAVTSKSPVGYGVKLYTGADGSYGLTPTNQWSPVIGTVLDATSMYFNPNQGKQAYNGMHTGFIATTTNADGGYTKISSGFCATYIDLLVTALNEATVPFQFMAPALMRGDNHTDLSPLANADSNGVDNFVGGVSSNGGGMNAFAAGVMKLNGQAFSATRPGQASQNRLYISRLEDGAYIYNGYPSGTSLLSNGAAGYADWKYSVFCRSYV